MVEKTSFIVKNNIPKIVDSLTGAQFKKLQESIGARLEGELVRRIQQGDPSWAPLSQPWIEKKGHGRQWYYTGRTEGAMKYRIDGSTIYVGIVDGGEIAEVAIKLEYGKGPIPARPLFQPVYHENKDKVVKEALDWVKDAIKKGKI